MSPVIPEQLLCLTRSPKKPGSFLGAIRKRLRFPKNRRSDTISDDDDDENHLVWDEPNPFAPDPTLAHLRALINAEIARTRRYESIGPLDFVDDDSAYDEDSDEDYDDGDSHSDGQLADVHDDGDSDGQLADDEDSDVDHGDVDDDGRDDRVANEDDGLPPILLPRLLPIPLRFLPSPPPPSPPPSDEDLSTPWADLAQVYNDIAESHERAARKEKRDVHRSRSKALAILGPEASSAL